MAKPVPITFGEWMPDMAPHMSPALAEATNVLPVAGAYAPFPGLVPLTGTTLPSAAMGFFATPQADGTAAVYAATATKIYQIISGATTVAYDAGSILARPWWFAVLNGKIITGNELVAPVSGAPTTTFTALAGAPPAAKVGAIVERNFLVLGNLTSDGIDGFQPARVRWSGFNNPGTWGTNVGTQADFEDMVDTGGPVVAITGRSTGTVFQRKAITRMQYVGGSVVFSFTVIELGRGPVSTGAVCDIGSMVFFRADDGFFAWDGTASTPIGTDKVDRWFAEHCESTRFDLISSAFDPVSRCVMWAFPEKGYSSNSKIIAFSLADQKWSLINFPAQKIATSISFARTLESMPTPDADALLSWDDSQFAGSLPVLSGIDGTNTYGNFTGANLPASIATGDFQAQPGQRSYVNSVRPITDAATGKIAVGEREQSGHDVVVWQPAVAQGVDGACPLRFDARYLRYRLTTDVGDDWSRAVGLEISLRGTGKR